MSDKTGIGWTEATRPPATAMTMRDARKQPVAAGPFRFDFDCGEVTVSHATRGIVTEVGALSPADARKAAVALMALADKAEAQTGGTVSAGENPAASLLRQAAEGMRKAAEAATKGPWWADDSDLCWRLHGVGFRVPPPPGAEWIGEQVLNKQILKAPKSGTPYAEYWPGEADAKWITGMHPGVGLAVAGWLEEMAFRAAGAVIPLRLANPETRRFFCRKCERPMEPAVTVGGCKCWDAALAVARAWLGEEAESGPVSLTVAASVAPEDAEALGMALDQLAEGEGRDA